MLRTIFNLKKIQMFKIFVLFNGIFLKRNIRFFRKLKTISIEDSEMNLKDVSEFGRGEGRLSILFNFFQSNECIENCLCYRISKIVAILKFQSKNFNLSIPKKIIYSYPINK